jgi:hypothetical protein
VNGSAHRDRAGGSSDVTSIFQRALGRQFSQLHPRLQHRLSMTSEDGLAQVGIGVMSEMTRSRLAAVPVLTLGRMRRLELPPAGREVRYHLANYAYRDTFERETFAYSRRFLLGHQVNRFDDTMVFSERRGCIVNYLGSHQDIAAELHLQPTESGGLRMRGGNQRIYQGRFGLKLPDALAAKAEVIETFDEEAERFTISVQIAAAGRRLFGYRGWFQLAEVPFTAEQIPLGIRPDRERRQD